MRKLVILVCLSLVCNVEFTFSILKPDFVTKCAFIYICHTVGNDHLGNLKAFFESVCPDSSHIIGNGKRPNGSP